MLEEEGLPDVGSNAEEMDLREREDKQLTATCPSGIGKTGLIWKKFQEDKEGHLTGFPAWVCDSLLNEAVCPRLMCPQWRALSPPLTGGLRLELLTVVCPIGLTQAGRPEVRVGGQDGRQVDGGRGLLGGRARLAGCGVALQGQRGSSWGHREQGGRLFDLLSKENKGSAYRGSPCSRSF